MKSNWTLKVLSGAHSKAEIPLGEGSFSVGRSEDNDLVFQDQFLPDHAAELSVTHDQVAVQIPDQDVGLKEVTLSPYQSVNIGGLELSVFPSDQGWQDPMIEPIGPGEAPPEGIESSYELNPSSPEIEVKPSKVSLTIGVLLLFIVSVIFFSYLFSGDSLEKKRSSLNEALKEFPVVQVSGEEQVLLQGYVATKEDRARLVSLVQSFGVPFVNRTVVHQSLKDATVLFLELHKLSAIEVTDGDQLGQLVLGGYVEDGIEWRQHFEKLQKDVPGVSQWVDQVETQGERVQKLQTMLQEKGLSEITLDQKPGKIGVSGLVPEEKMAAWKEVEADFVKEYGDKPQIVGKTTEIKDLQITSISLGEDPYIIVEDGTRYLTGAELDGGYIVKKIMADRIILERDGALTTYFMGQ